MSVDIFVLVNQEFDNDPRVSRAVQFLGQQGYQVAVASGITRSPTRKVEMREWGSLHYFRTLKAGQVAWLRPLARFASARTEKTANIAVTYSRLPLLDRLFRTLLYLSQLLNLLLLNLRLVIRFYSLPVRLYYPNDFDVAGAGAILAWLHQKPLVYETHELYVDQITAYPAWYRRVLMFLEDRWARRSASVITVGEYIAQILHERYRLEKQPAVIRSCPPYQSIIKSPKSNSPFKLLYHGAYHAERGLEQLILAMHHINNAHLYLRGFGYWEEPLRNLVNRESLQSKVSFLPPVPMEQLVEAAVPYDIGVGAFQDASLNSRYCLPNKVFEYMMAGLALAVSDLPELRRIVYDYNTGVTFEPSNPVDVARQINSLLTDPGRLYQMQTNALCASRDVFNFEREGDKLRQIIEGMIGLPAMET